MTNHDLCLKVFEFLKASQVETVVICAGARNAPLVHHAEGQNFKKVYFFEERSAAFYALGCIKKSGRPAAVITTSGTAAAELLPATVESYYQGLPLILITADRPKSYRNTGAPQTINQLGLYSHYVESSYDWDIHSAEFVVTGSLGAPVHFNVCFDEPLIDGSKEISTSLEWKKIQKRQFAKATAEDFKKVQNPLIVVGQIDNAKKQKVIQFIKAAKAPVYLEALSQLQSEPEIEPYVLKSTDLIAGMLFRSKLCESLIRIGGIPTLRFWRDLEQKFHSIPVYNFTDVPFSGLARPSSGFQLDFTPFKSATSPQESLKAAKDLDATLQSRKIQLLEKYPLSEQNLVFELSKVIGNEPIYIGNSLPIREWDMFSDTTKVKDQPVYANRGANGIDGQISTYLGWTEDVASSWCFIGDLTAMYDLPALGLGATTSKDKKRIVVMNNFGGQIFKRVFKGEHFLNVHNIEFSGWAKMWTWSYFKVTTSEMLKSITGDKTIIEIQPSAEQTDLFWREWDEACTKI